jgi:hypothetical protein
MKFSFPVAVRLSFEQWISGPPYERDLHRWPMDETKHPWPGQYRDIDVQLAWESWQVSACFNDLEKAWREGYDSGYNNGSNDAHSYECGSGSNKRTAQDRDDEWNGSETKLGHELT